MRRREFIGLLGGASARPIAASGQSVPVIGFVNGSSATAYALRFTHGLAETGHVVGKSVAIEYRWAEVDYERSPMELIT